MNLFDLNSKQIQFLIWSPNFKIVPTGFFFLNFSRSLLKYICDQNCLYSLCFLNLFQRGIGLSVFKLYKFNLKDYEIFTYHFSSFFRSLRTVGMVLTNSPWSETMTEQVLWKLCSLWTTKMPYRAMASGLEFKWTIRYVL